MQKKMTNYNALYRLCKEAWGYGEGIWVGNMFGFKRQNEKN